MTHLLPVSINLPPYKWSIEYLCPRLAKSGWDWNLGPNCEACPTADWWNMIDFLKLKPLQKKSRQTPSAFVKTFHRLHTRNLSSWLPSNNSLISCTWLRKQIMDLIRDCIKNNGESRYSIAKSTGIDQTTLHRIVRGGSCQAETAEKLLDHFGYEIRKKKRG